jgi:hypothetical protein
MPNNISKTIKVMSKLLDAIIEEGKRLKSSGWKPKFRGDTGINICQIMIDNDVKLRNQHDRGLIEGYIKNLNKK